MGGIIHSSFTHGLFILDSAVASVHYGAAWFTVLFIVLSLGERFGSRRVFCKHFPFPTPWLMGCSVILNCRVVCNHVSLCYIVEPLLLSLLLVYYNLHPSLGLNCIQGLGVEDKRMGLISLLQRGTSWKDKSGWWIFYAHPEEHCKGRHSLRGCGAEQGMLPYVGCVGIVDSRPDRYCGGVPSSWVSH